jgi:hypothetical protein
MQMPSGAFMVIPAYLIPLPALAPEPGDIVESPVASSPEHRLLSRAERAYIIRSIAHCSFLRLRQLTQKEDKLTVYDPRTAKTISIEGQIWKIKPLNPDSLPR